MTAAHTAAAAGAPYNRRMYAQCPECLAIFELDATDLAALHGNVRCGHCAALFDALRTLAVELPPEPVERLDTHPTAMAPPLLSRVVLRPNPAQGMLFAPAARERTASKRSTPPPFAASRRPAQRGGNWPWVIGCALLLLVLGGEIAWAERARWIDDARVRPWLDTACATLGCRLPLRRDTTALSLLSRDIRPHPSVEGALIVSATLRNDADFAQPYPFVDIALSDLDEKRIAMRRFAPREYLGDTRTIEQGIEPDTSIALVFEIADPGRDAVAFEFKFE